MPPQDANLTPSFGGFGVKLNVMDSVGREVMHAYGVSLVPTFLVFDGAGNLIFRQAGTFPDVQTIKAKVRGEIGSIDTRTGMGVGRGTRNYILHTCACSYYGKLTERRVKADLSTGPTVDSTLDPNLLAG